MRERQARRQTPAILLLLSVVAAVPYLTTVQHEFIAYDDNQYVTENAFVLRGLTWPGVRWAFTTFTASNWHPMTWISHMIDVQVWGLWPGGHHLTNVVLHAANTLVIFLVLRRLTGAKWRSAFVAVIFAIHPLHVESVAWVAERKDLLSALFGVLAMGAYAKYAHAPSFLRYVAVVGLFGLSLMSKPMLVTLPFVLLLLDVWPLNRLAPQPRITIRYKGLAAMPKPARLVVEKLPLLAMAAAMSVITIIAQKGSAIMDLQVLPLPQRIANAVVAYGMYLAKMIWPASLAVIYPLRVPAPWQTVVSASVLLIITAAVLVSFRRRPYLLVGWLWFLGTLVPVIGLVQVGVQSMADRYMYVPMVGLLIMAAWTVPAITLKSKWRALPAALTMVVIAALTIQAWRQTQHWRNSETLFRYAIRVTDRNAVAYNLLGVTLRQNGEEAQAFDHVRQALTWNPNYAAAHNNMGRLWMDQARYADAADHYRRSLQLNPDNAHVWFNLGSATFQQGRMDEAADAFRRAIHLQPDLAEALAQLGAVYWNIGQSDDAIRHYQRSLAIDSTHAETHVNLGVALAAKGDLNSAIDHFERALALDPERRDAKQFLEMAREQK